MPKVGAQVQSGANGDLLSDAQLASAAAAAERAEDFVTHKHESKLASFAAEVWAECLQEMPVEGAIDETPAATRLLRCNPACLRQRILSSFPCARGLLEAEGWDHYFARKLLEQGVVTYTVKHLPPGWSS